MIRHPESVSNANPAYKVRCVRVDITIIMLTDLRLRAAQKWEGASDGIPRFYYPIVHHEKRVRITTPPRLLDRLIYSSSSKGVMVEVPIDPCVREALDAIETFVQSTVSVPPEFEHLKPVYKRLSRSRRLNLLLCERAALFYQPPNDFLTILPHRELPQFGPAMVSFDIYIKSVYVGPHRDGSLISIIPYVGNVSINC